MIQKEHNLTDWVNTYTAELFKWALYKVTNEELAKDLVQDTFVAATEKVKDFKGDSSPKTWLFSILNHKIIDIYRKNAKKPIAVEPKTFSDFFDENGDWFVNKRPQSWDDSDGHLLDDAEFNAVLKACIETLPEKWKTCIKFKYYFNKNTDEICQEMEIAPTNLWQIMHRAKLNLRDCIDTNWFQN